MIEVTRVERVRERNNNNGGGDHDDLAANRSNEP